MLPNKLSRETSRRFVRERDGRLFHNNHDGALTDAADKSGSRAFLIGDGGVGRFAGLSEQRAASGFTLR